MTEQPKFLRQIKSFVKREGRLTEGQSRIIQESPYLLNFNELSGILDLEKIFGRAHAKTTFEIGFGNGESLAKMAKDSPERNFIGIEVHTPGVGHLLLELEKEQLTNVRVISHDAVEVLKRLVPNNGLDRVQIFFPDPWHKKRHHKRRLIQKEFVDLLVLKLHPQGIIHFATDWENYAEQMLEVLNANPSLKNLYEGFTERPDFRPETKFEARGIRLGHDIFDLLFEKTK